MSADVLHTSSVAACDNEIFVQWHRSVIKYGGQGQWGQAIKLFQITPYVNDFRTIPRFLAACGRLEKLVLPSVFDASL